MAINTIFVTAQDVYVTSTRIVYIFFFYIKKLDKNRKLGYWSSEIRFSVYNFLSSSSCISVDSVAKEFHQFKGAKSQTILSLHNSVSRVCNILWSLRC